MWLEMTQKQEDLNMESFGEDSSSSTVKPVRPVNKEKRNLNECSSMMKQHIKRLMLVFVSFFFVVVEESKCYSIKQLMMTLLRHQ